MSYSPEDIIKLGDDIILQFGKVDSKLLAKILQILANNTKDGKINIPNQDLAIIEDILFDELKSSEYGNKANEYLALFSKLQDSMIAEQVEINKLKRKELNDLWLNDEVRKKISDKVIYDLGEAGIKKAYINGLAEAIREQNYFNRKLSEATEILRTKMNGYTENYLRSTVMDSMRMYDGAFQDKIKVVYDFKNIRFIGNIIETSRPICTHLRNDLKGKFSVEQLKLVLDDYCPNGNPSEKKITYKTVSGKEYTQKKGAGMHNGTTIDNFGQFAGGWQCRHRVIYTR